MIAQYVLLFFVYSFIGWLVEIFERIIIEKKFINRGFLIGPYVPVWGFGAILMTLLLHNYVNEPLVFILLAMFISGVLEYLTSYFMEKIFHARWWDYSDHKFNLNGRVCLLYLIGFAVGGYIVVGIANPGYFMMLDFLSIKALDIIAIVLSIIFITDILLSSHVIVKLKGTVGNAKDNTEEISKKVRETLSANLFHRRILHSYPHLRENIVKVEKKIAKEIKKDLGKLKRH